MPFQTTNLVNYAYYHDEFKLFMIYAPLGYGKTTFACKVLAELYNNDWEEVKRHLVFDPKDFIERCLTMGKTRKRDKALVWDDAGLWLFALKRSDPLVEAVVKYLNVARTNWGALIFTTPTPSWITYKIRNFPQSVRVRIIKLSSDKKRIQRLRLARAYRAWVAPDFKKDGVRKYYEEYFDATMPKDFYEWYRPLREGYAVVASGLMEASLESIARKQPKIDVDLTREQYTV